MTWEDRLGELADFCKIHGHCNVPRRYKGNDKLGQWVSNQRVRYNKTKKEKIAFLSLSQIQALESLGFEWSRKETPKKRNLDLDDAMPSREPDVDVDAIVRAKDSVAAKPSQHRHRQPVFTHALLLGDGATGGNSPEASTPPPDESDASEDTQQPPQDEVFQSDNVLSEVELELIWLGEESMYCLSSPEFQFDFIYEYATSALKVELRKLSRDDESETNKLKEIVRIDDWLVSRRLDFVRKDIRTTLRRGFRRQRMRTVIAELRLMRRQEPKRQFPAMMIPSRT
jgi:hypothetical protein